MFGIHEVGAVTVFVFKTELRDGCLKCGLTCTHVLLDIHCSEVRENFRAELRVVLSRHQPRDDASKDETWEMKRPEMMSDPKGVSSNFIYLYGDMHSLVKIPFVKKP